MTAARERALIRTVIGRGVIAPQQPRERRDAVFQLVAGVVVRVLIHVTPSVQHRQRRKPTRCSVRRTSCWAKGRWRNLPAHQQAGHSCLGDALCCRSAAASDVTTRQVFARRRQRREPGRQKRGLASQGWHCSFRVIDANDRSRPTTGYPNLRCAAPARAYARSQKWSVGGPARRLAIVSQPWPHSRVVIVSRPLSDLAALARGVVHCSEITCPIIV